MIPIKDKCNLTIKEAAEYFSIGEKRIRKLATTTPHCDFVVHSGNRILIRKAEFEAFTKAHSYL